jgi:hypothetical protein
MPNSQDPVAAVHVSNLKNAFTIYKKLHADVIVAALQPPTDITEGEAGEQADSGCFRWVGSCAGSIQAPMPL